ncbi:hypothetical protein AWENTII_011178 [Aspergillus wentii]
MDRITSTALLPEIPTRRDTLQKSPLVLDASYRTPGLVKTVNFILWAKIENCSIILASCPAAIGLFYGLLSTTMAKAEASATGPDQMPVNTAIQRCKLTVTVITRTQLTSLIKATTIAVAIVNTDIVLKVDDRNCPISSSNA